jgi:hypothetical protein
MFDRYTEKARRTLFFGRYEASQFGSRYIQSEHLLLGLLREDKPLANTFLPPGGIESIRKAVELKTIIREKISTSIDLPLSQECQSILRHAAQESEKLSHKFIGTAHIFLGMLRERECFAAKLLRERGIALEMAREQIGSKLAEETGPAPKSPGLPAGYTSNRLLYNSITETLILELRASSAFHLPSRLFSRRRDKEAYEQIGSLAEDVSYESPVTCSSLPLVTFNSMKWGKTGGSWNGTYFFNLSTKDLELCISPQNLRLSEAHGRLWITDLIYLSENARTLYINIAVEKTVSGGGILHYYFAKVDLPEQEVTLLSRLLDLRF